MEILFKETVCRNGTEHTIAQNHHAKIPRNIIFKNCWRIISDQKRTTVMVQVLEAMLYNEKLEQLNLLSLSKRNK